MSDAWCQTLNCQWKKKYLWNKTNKFTFILHKFNKYLQKNGLKRYCFLMICNKLKEVTLILFRMGFLGAAHGWESKKAKSKISKNLSHILQWWNLAIIPYLKKIQKLYKSHDTPLDFYWHQHQLLLYQEMQIDWILTHNF